MRSGGVIIVSVATLLVCCYGTSQQEQDISVGERRENYDASGNKAKRPDSHQTDKRLYRQVREAHISPYALGRRYEYGSPYGARHVQWSFMSPMEYGLYGEGLPKRNFDEIDRSSLDSFVKKRNFDEIDQTSMPFPSKRRVIISGVSGADTSSSLDSFVKKRNFDEIDQTSMPFPSKRRVIMSGVGDDTSSHGHRQMPGERVLNFDDMEETQTPSGGLRLAYGRFLPPFK